MLLVLNRFSLLRDRLELSSSLISHRERLWQLSVELGPYKAEADAFVGNVEAARVSMPLSTHAETKRLHHFIKITSLALAVGLEFLVVNKSAYKTSSSHAAQHRCDAVQVIQASLETSCCLLLYNMIYEIVSRGLTVRPIRKHVQQTGQVRHSLEHITWSVMESHDSHSTAHAKGRREQNAWEE